MYYIIANGNLVYDPADKELILYGVKLNMEIGKAGSLQFQVPLNHKYYTDFAPLKTIVTVELDGVEIFRGRVLTNNRNFNNTRIVYCEGNLAYLVDSVQKGTKFEGKAHALFRRIIHDHNSRVETEKKFYIGDITIDNRDVVLLGKSDDAEPYATDRFDYRQIAIDSVVDEWHNTYDYIENCLIDYCGGYLRTRYDDSTNRTYIDYLKEYPSKSGQTIEFSVNMLDLTEEVSSDDLFTVLIPLGDENLTLSGTDDYVDSNYQKKGDELIDRKAVEKYGRIVQTHVFDGVNKVATLLENARRFMKNHENMPVTFTIKAVDMHFVDSNLKLIQAGDKVKVISYAHGIEEYFVCTKVEYDLENPSNSSYTFGQPKQTLTERYRKDKAKQTGSSRSGGGGGRGGGGGGRRRGAGSSASSDTTSETGGGVVDTILGYVGDTGGEIVSTVTDVVGALTEKQDEVAEERENAKLDEFFNRYIQVDESAGKITLGATYKGLNNLATALDLTINMSDGTLHGEYLGSRLSSLTNDILSTTKIMIDAVSDGLMSRLALTVEGQNNEGDNNEAHRAEFEMWANDLQSGIRMKADQIELDALKIAMHTTAQRVTDIGEKLITSCGIDIDSEQGSVNIYSMSESVDGLIGSTASIGLHTDEHEARIQMLASYVNTEGDENEEHRAEFEMWANALESGIRMKADKIDLEAIKISMKTANERIDDIGNKLRNQCGIEIDSDQGNVNLYNIAELTDENGRRLAYSEAWFASHVTPYSAVSTWMVDHQITTDRRARERNGITRVRNPRFNPDLEEDPDTNPKYLYNTNLAFIKMTADDLGSDIELNAKNIRINAQNLKATADYLDLSINDGRITVTGGLKIDSKITKISGEVFVDKLTTDAITSKLVNADISGARYIYAYGLYERNSSGTPYRLATRQWVIDNFSSKTHTHSFSASNTIQWAHTHSNSGAGGISNYKALSISVSGTTDTPS